MSFQCNCVADLIDEGTNFQNSSEKFKNVFNDVKKSFQQNNFHIANLRANLRNSEQISKVTLDNAHDSFNVKNEVTHLKSSIKGEIPFLLPIHVNELKNNLAKTLHTAIQSITSRSSMVQAVSSRSKIIILHDGQQFSSHQIEQSVNSLNSNYKVRVFEPDPENTTLSEMEFIAFLRSIKNEILISHQEFIVGAESCNVIFLSSDKNCFNSSFRCTLFRAVEKLFVIHSYDDSCTGFTTLHGFKIQKQFLRCAEEMRTYDYNVKCFTCLEAKKSSVGGVVDEDEFIICKSCYYGCHYEHVVVKTESNYDPVCGCKDLNMCNI